MVRRWCAADSPLMPPHIPWAAQQPKSSYDLAAAARDELGVDGLACLAGVLPMSVRRDDHVDDGEV